MNSKECIKSVISKGNNMSYLYNALKECPIEHPTATRVIIKYYGRICGNMTEPEVSIDYTSVEVTSISSDKNMCMNDILNVVADSVYQQCVNRNSIEHSVDLHVWFDYAEIIVWDYNFKRVAVQMCKFDPEEIGWVVIPTTYDNNIKAVVRHY